jgi:hypothetical protein
MMRSTIAKADAAQKKIDAKGTDFALKRNGHKKPQALMAEVNESTKRVRGRNRSNADVFINFLPEQ